jgi:hypothetical protein
MAAPAISAAIKTAVSKTATNPIIHTSTTKPAIQEAAKNIVHCRWWNGSDLDSVIDSSKFLINGGGKISETDLKENSMIAQEMEAKFEDVGLLHVQHTGLTDMNLQRRLAELVMGPQTPYEGGANPRDRLEELGNVSIFAEVFNHRSCCC